MSAQQHDLPGSPGQQPNPDGVAVFDGPSDVAVAVGTRAVAGYADRHNIRIPDAHREPLALAVLTAALATTLTNAVSAAISEATQRA